MNKRTELQTIYKNFKKVIDKITPEMIQELACELLENGVKEPHYLLLIKDGKTSYYPVTEILRKGEICQYYQNQQNY